MRPTLLKLLLVLATAMAIVPVVVAQSASTPAKAVAAEAKGDGLSDAKEAEKGCDPSKVDSDSDGMLDGWEVTYGLDCADKSDAGGDPDGDGQTNRQEHDAGTNPRVANEAPAPDKQNGCADAAAQPNAANDCDADGVRDGGPDKEERDNCRTDANPD